MGLLLESVLDVLEAYDFTVLLRRPDPTFIMAWRSRGDGAAGKVTDTENAVTDDGAAHDGAAHDGAAHGGAAINGATINGDSCWYAAQDRAGPADTAGGDAAAGAQVLYCHVLDETQHLVVHVLLPFRTSGQGLEAVDERLAALNSQARLVQFRRHKPSGLLECRASQRICAGRTGQAQIDQLVFLCLNAADAYQSAILGIIQNHSEL